MLMALYHLERFLHLKGVPLLPRIVKGFIYAVFHCVIPPECAIGHGAVFWHHGLGVVIHPGTRIGRNCHIYNHVVLGGGHDGPAGPPSRITIGDNVMLSAGAKILCRGETLTIGDNSIVGANAVVLGDVPPNVVVGGIPARILGTRDDVPVGSRGVGST